MSTSTTSTSGPADAPTHTADAASPVTAATASVGRIADRLFPHQVEGVAFLLRRRRALLADDMGLGKTRQAVIGLHVAEPGGPYLVVCPASVKRNWAREIETALPGATVRIITGKSDDAPLDATWIVVNYDVLASHAVRLAEHPWRGIVFDEAHYIRNHQSQRSRHSRSLVDAAADPVVYALTGTPLTNRPRDLFPLLQLCGHPLAKSFLSFAKRYCAAYRNDFGWVTDGASNLQELATQLQGVMLRRTKDDVLDLPPKLRTWLSVDVPAGTGAKEVSAVVRLLLARGNGNGAHGGGDAADRGRLLALLSTARLKLAAAKTTHTIEFVSNAVEQGGKVIVFSCFDEPVKKIKAHFGDAAVLLTGATPAAKRQSLVDRFQDDDGVRVFVANIIAGGIGLNLTAARHVVFNDLDWVPSNHWQAEDRAVPYRPDAHGARHVHEWRRYGG
jgi:SWI/SNF-related matrix-associated actin-dependent regulator of chromatin subfamily A-like protein 1